MLASAEGATVSRQTFVKAVWDGNDLVGDRGVSDTIFSLRRALCDDDPKLPLIRTIPRRGYQLCVPVKSVAASPNAFMPDYELLHSSGWRLVRKLGESAQSETWLGEPSVYNGELENTAPRVFRFCRSQAYLRRLQREVTLLRYVNQSLSEHPGFAVIRDWQLDEPPYFLARDFARYGSLGEWTQAQGMPPAPPLRLMMELSEALAALHQLGIVHQDLSVDRILVDETDAGPQFKMSALGLGALADRSKLAPLQITALGLTMGAEEAGAQASSADDVAALGLVFLQLSVGDWHAKPNETWLGRVTDTDLQTLLRQCLGAAEARPSAIELARQLRALTPGATVDAQANPVAPQSGPENALAVASIQPVKRPSAPETIGRYRLLDRLGEGGMGMVYLAEQRDPYRKVALKIIRSGLDGQQILSRFEAERQALAMMNHPNVASVLDSGLADDGRPYFAMEYIAGEDIKGYSDRHHLNIGARVKLFLQVCDGVLHAHQKGVLHRDIKPSNLMVAATTDQAGIVKVIDFGLAKSLHGKLATQTLHTSFGAFVGTPVYSSPEHVSGSAAGVDTRSDIYSLGVVLYELLVGMTPIASESLNNLEPEKIREIVCKSKLPTMREQLQNTSADRREQLAQHRSIKVDELPKALEGDLSWVVGKCLERDPNDRYASVLALKDDLERWLDLRPVEARPTSGWYRFRKLVQRNRGPALLIACAAAALLMTTTAAVVGYLRAERALETSRLAEAEATKAADFQVRQMQSVDPAAMGLSLRERLVDAVKERGAERGWDPVAVTQGEQALGRLIEGVNFTDLSLEQLEAHQFRPTLASITNDFKDQPLLQARLWQSLADSLVKLGRIEAATEPQRLALEQRQRLLGKDDPLSLISLRSQGSLLLKKGQHPQAEADLRTAATSMRRVLGSRHPETLASQMKLCEALFAQDRIEEALVPAQEVLDASRQALGEDDRTTLDAKLLMGNILFRLQRYAEVEAYYQEALDGYKRVHGNQHPETWKPMNNLAAVFLITGRYAQAETVLAQLLSDQRLRLGNDHESTLTTQLNLTTALRYQGRLAESEDMTRKLLLIVQQTLGKEHPKSLEIESNLARLLLEQGKVDDSIALYKGLLATTRRTLSRDDRTSDRYVIFLAIALRKNGEFNDAQRLLSDLLRAQRSELGDSHRNTLATMAELANVSEAQGDVDAAESMLREALAGRRALFGNTSRDTLNTLDQLGQFLRRRGKLEEAATMGQEAINGASNQPYPQNPIGLYLIHQAGTLMDLQRIDDAESLLDKARTRLSQDAYPSRNSVEELAEAYIDLYARRHELRPEPGLVLEAESWRKILEAMKQDPARPVAEILLTKTD